MIPAFIALVLLAADPAGPIDFAALFPDPPAAVDFSGLAPPVGAFPPRRFGPPIAPTPGRRRVMPGPPRRPPPKSVVRSITPRR